MGTVADVLTATYDGLVVFALMMVMAMLGGGAGFLVGFFVARSPHPTVSLEVDNSNRSREKRGRRIPIHKGGVRVGTVEVPGLVKGYNKKR